MQLMIAAVAIAHAIGGSNGNLVRVGLQFRRPVPDPARHPLCSAVKIVQEYERGVIFRLGRLVGAKGPGLFFIIPFVDRMVKVDLRVVTLDIPAQEAITRDNVTVKVNAVAYFRVRRPVDGHRRGGGLPPGHLADRPDHPAQRAGPVGPGRAADPARRDQPEAAADHRRADRAVGHQGQHRRGQGRGAARHA